MSDFLFFQPDSNPSSFSSKERFSRRPASFSLPKPLPNNRSPVDVDSYGTKPYEQPPSLSATATATTSTQAMQDVPYEGNSNTGALPKDDQDDTDDTDSLHSLFYGSETDPDDVAPDLTEQVAASGGAPPRWDVTPENLSPNQSLGKQHIDEHEQLGSRELDSAAAHPVVESESAGSPAGGPVHSAFTPYLAISSEVPNPPDTGSTGCIQNLGVSPYFLEQSQLSGIQAEFATLADEEDMDFASNNYCPIQVGTCDLGFEDHTFEGPAESPTRTASPGLATDDVYLRGCGESPERDTARSQSDRTTGHEANGASNSEACPTPVSLQLAGDMEIHDANDSCMMITDSPSQVPENGFNGLVNRGVEAWSDPCFSGEADDVGSTEVAGHNMPATCDQPTPPPHRTIQPQQAKCQWFSHVEIRNTQPPTAVTVPAERDGETASIEAGSIHCSPRGYGPWQLTGTTLSIDIREVGHIPVMGFSTYQVADGYLYQMITLNQGNTSFPVISEDIRTARKQHSRGMRKARKTDKVAVSPGPPGDHPLSLEQKQRLMRLRAEGHTWNDIASRFPGRKKGSLQQIYYTQVRRSGKQAAKTSQHSTRHRPASNEHHDVDPGESEKTTDVSRLSGNQLAKAAAHPRYSFRARRVA